MSAQLSVLRAAFPGLTPLQVTIGYTQYNVGKIQYTIDGSGNIIRIGAFSNNLGSISIPPQLTSLQTLYLGFNHITSISIPPQLTSLQTLILSNNNLGSISIPPQLTSLQYLDLNQNNLGSISIPSELTSLQSLYLSQNQLTNTISIPPQLTSLQSLYLISNQLTSISIPRQLTSLQSLYLGQNQLTSISIPSELTSLQNLDLSQNQLTNTISIPPQLTSLQNLYLGQNQLTSIIIPPELTLLQYLGLNDNYITSISIPLQLTSLIGLSLTNNDLSVLPYIRSGIVEDTDARTFCPQNDNGLVYVGLLNSLGDLITRGFDVSCVVCNPGTIKVGNDCVAVPFIILEDTHDSTSITFSWTGCPLTGKTLNWTIPPNIIGGNNRFGLVTTNSASYGRFTINGLTPNTLYKNLRLNLVDGDKTVSSDNYITFITDPCNAGNYYSSGTCTPCPAGTFSNSSTRFVTQCTLCTGQTYSKTAGATSCTPCSDDKVSSSDGTSCVYCDPGKGVKGGDLPFNGTCQTCPDGYKPVNDVCTMCIAGTYCKNGIENNCPSGKSSVSFSSTISQCLNCPSGSYSDATTSYRCEYCPAGQYSIQGGSCTNCPAGQYSISGGSCTLCPFRMVSAAGSASCGYCPVGYGLPDKYLVTGFQGAQASDCEQCQAGTYALNDECITCPEGSYCPIGSSNYTSCGAGKTSPSDSTSISACVCSPGYGGERCTICTAGTYSAGGSASCAACPIGTYSDTAGSSSCTQCPNRGTTDSSGSTKASQCHAQAVVPQAPSQQEPSQPSEKCETSKWCMLFIILFIMSLFMDIDITYKIIFALLVIFFCRCEELYFQI
jgi:Leucine-rich repeat (LRR) protein